MKKNVFVKKIALLTALLLLILSLSACAGKQETAVNNGNDGTAMSNDTGSPFTAYETLEELNKAVGCHLCRPEAELREETFTRAAVYDTDGNETGSIALYHFEYEGIRFMFHAGMAENRVIRYEFGGMERPAEGEPQIVGDDENRSARWYIGNMCYYLSANGNEEKNIGEIDFDSLTGAVCEAVVKASK